MIINCTKEYEEFLVAVMQKLSEKTVGSLSVLAIAEDGTIVCSMYNCDNKDLSQMTTYLQAINLKNIMENLNE